jgi:tRNA U34 2-thiouridine synthase MnmA/TrmU
MIESLFRNSTKLQLKRGGVQDPEQLIIAFGSYIDGHSQNTKPFLRTANAAFILECSQKYKLLQISEDMLETLVLPVRTVDEYQSPQ